MQWRLQVNRLQELIDQLECKVGAVWPVSLGKDFPGISVRQACTGDSAYILCPS